MVNKKAQMMEFAFFALALLVSIGAVMIILDLNMPDVTSVGQAAFRVLATTEIGENAKVHLDMIAKQNVPKVLPELIQTRGYNIPIFEGQPLGITGCEELHLPIITPDCFPNYKETYEIILSREITLEMQKYDLVNFARNTVNIEYSQNGIVDIILEEPIIIDIKRDSESYYLVRQRPGPTRTQQYITTNEGYLFRGGLNSLSRGNSEADTIVMHWTATQTVEAAYQALLNAGLSYHYIIDKDGQIYQFITEDRSAQHAGCGKEGRPNCISGFNSRSIGISLVSCGYNHTGCTVNQCYQNTLINGRCFEEYTEQQIQSTINLITDITLRNPTIILSETTLIGHDAIDTTRKVDPGPQFPYQQIIQEVNNRIRGGPLV